MKQAERACQELGAQLPLPENQKQNEDMLIAFREMTIYNHYDSWIVLGIKNKGNEGEWVKSNGENVTYFNWDKNEPNRPYGGPNYVIFRISERALGRYRSDVGKWNEREDLYSYFPVICQQTGKRIVSYLSNANFCIN